MTWLEKLDRWINGEVTPQPLSESKTPVVVKEEVKEQKHVRPYLDANLYEFALKMQSMIKEKKVQSSDYTTQDLEKIDDDIASINAQYLEHQEFSEFEVKAATRLFLLNNQLSN